MCSTVDPKAPPATWGTVDPAAFRRTMRHIPTAVAIVTTTVGTTPVGLLVGSFASVSLEPALVTFFVDKQSTTWPQMHDSDTFAINILGHGMGARCKSFAGKGVDRFAGVQWNPSEDGDPILAEASVVFECTKALHPMAGRPHPGRRRGATSSTSSEKNFRWCITRAHSSISTTC